MAAPRAVSIVAGSSLTAAAAYAAASAPAARKAEAGAIAQRGVAFAALGGGSALALSTGWYGLAPSLIPTVGYPLRAYALRSVVLHTAVLPPVLATTVWVGMSIDEQSHAHFGPVYAQVLGSTWILAAGCQSAYHLLLEQRGPRVLIPAALLAGLLQWSMFLGTIRQGWSEFGLDGRHSRTAISRWRTQSTEQEKLPVAVAIRKGES